MTGDLFDDMPEPTPEQMAAHRAQFKGRVIEPDEDLPAKPEALNLRKGSRVRVTGDGGSDPHGVRLGKCGTVADILDGKPHDGNAQYWREDGARVYLVNIDGDPVDAHVALWPDELERE